MDKRWRCGGGCTHKHTHKNEENFSLYVCLIFLIHSTQLMFHLHTQDPDITPHYFRLDEYSISFQSSSDIACTIMMMENVVYRNYQNNFSSSSFFSFLLISKPSETQLCLWLMSILGQNEEKIHFRSFFECISVRVLEPIPKIDQSQRWVKIKGVENGLRAKKKENKTFFVIYFLQ